MRARAPIERRLPDILAELGAAPYPEYTDALLARTATARQRPGWVFPERWVPVTMLSSAAVLPRFPWRPIALVALLILTVVAGTILIAAPRQPPLPAPFGRAANGLIAYSTDGDIYAADPVTGEARAIVTGPDADSDPAWSRDGTHIAFRRASGIEAGGKVSAAGALFVVRPDGTDLRQITPEPMPLGLQQYSFSPDGREIIFVADGSSMGDLYVAKTDGSGDVRRLDVGMRASDPAYRPPDGHEIVFSGSPTGDTSNVGMYRVKTDGTGLVTLVEPSLTAAAVSPAWSPDGSRIAYSTVDFMTGWGWLRTHTMMADGTRQRAVPAPPDSHWDFLGGWSNDGTRLVVIRGYSADGSGPMTAAVVPVEGSDPGVETDHGSDITNDAWPLWAPDDGSILIVRPNWDEAPSTALLMDPTTAAASSTTFAPELPAWQRVAPPG